MVVISLPIDVVGYQECVAAKANIRVANVKRSGRSHNALTTFRMN